MNSLSINDLAEIKFTNANFDNIYHTRIIEIDRKHNKIIVKHAKTDSLIILNWNNIEDKWTLDDGTVLNVNFRKSVRNVNKGFPFYALEEEAKYQILLNTKPKEFVKLCDLPDFSSICVDNSNLVTRLYKEKLERDINPDILELGYKFTKDDNKITWKEFYNKMLLTQDLKKELESYSDPDLITSAMDVLLFDKEFLVAKILMNLNSSLRPSFTGLDSLALKHNFKFLDYLKENDLLPAPIPMANLRINHQYYYRWLTTGK